METITSLVADARNRAEPLFDAPGRATPMTAAEAAGSAWQMGNLLRHYGVRRGERVAVVSGPTDPGPDDERGTPGRSPVPILAVLGALVAGGVVDLDPPRAVGATALVLPAAWLNDYRPGPGTTAIAYGDDPADPGVAHLEREAWSENRTPPPVDLDPTSAALAASRVFVHADLVTAAHRLAASHSLSDVDRVVLAAPPATAGAFVAGVLAPLVAGATVVLGEGDEIPVGDGEDGSVAAGEDGSVAAGEDGSVAVGDEGTVVVASEAIGEARRIDPASALGEDT